MAMIEMPQKVMTQRLTKFQQPIHLEQHLNSTPQLFQQMKHQRSSMVLKSEKTTQLRKVRNIDIFHVLLYQKTIHLY